MPDLSKYEEILLYIIGDSYTGDSPIEVMMYWCGYLSCAAENDLITKDEHRDLFNVAGDMVRKLKERERNA